eukprot:COSAG02_NODE_5_length_66751_cov_63.939148_24_plen_79_part_00
MGGSRNYFVLSSICKRATGTVRYNQQSIRAIIQEYTAMDEVRRYDLLGTMHACVHICLKLDLVLAYAKRSVCRGYLRM